LEEKNISFKNNDVLVFIPGYKGSKLVDSKNQETIWLSLHEILSEKNTLVLKNENPLTVGGLFDNYAHFSEKAQQSLSRSK
jgi:hypothetical protein